MQWYNEPASYTVNDDTIRVTSAPKTDFWRISHYGFIRDDGHFFYEPVTGNFNAGVKVVGAYATLYDQAGMMIRIDDRNWIKCGVEYVDGVQYASAVVTREFSDWSVVTLPPNPPALWLKLNRDGDAVEISYSIDGTNYHMLRLAYFPTVETVQIGVMCAAPQGEGFEATFEGYFCKTKTG